MIYLIIGFSKSGTTLTARTLDTAGINFRPERKRSDYPACPYENLEGCKIIMQQISVDRKRSLYMPIKIKDSDKIKPYIKKRSQMDREWGFKFPYLTFVYDIWRKYLPEHITIALKRTPEGIIKHYSKRGKYWDHGKGKELILSVQGYYNKLIDIYVKNYGINVIYFEDFIERGPVELEKIIGRKLPDVRDGKEH